MMSWNMLLELFIFCHGISIIVSWPGFEDLIPNGNSVPYACNISKIWLGVGHLGRLGSGPLNPFGVDFQKAGMEWTRELCEMDSDDDGTTNGAELGDISCQWNTTNNIKLQPAVSNPGICDPWNSEKCNRRNGSLLCNTPTYKCDNKMKPGVKKEVLKLQSLVVPSKKWTFACKIFNFPSDRAYHLIEGEPIINETAPVLSAIGVYGCDPKNPIMQPTDVLDCSSLLHPPCQDLLAVVKTGIEGSCYPHDVGVPMGLNGYRQVLVRWIFVNPQNLRGVRSSSGMSLYYTPQLQKLTAGFATIEDTHFSVPPEVGAYEVSSACPSGCTKKKLKGPITVISGFNMMNAHGTKQIIEVFRKDRVYNTITEDYSYNVLDPNVFWYTSPVPILPGDMLRLRCEYNTTGVKQSLGWGNNVNEELCRGKIMYYPRENWEERKCDSFRTIPVCELEIGATIYDCSINILNKSLQTLPLYLDLMAQCSANKVCSPLCLRKTVESRRTPCLSGDYYSLWKLVSRGVSKLSTLYKALKTCEADYDAFGGFRSNTRRRS